MVSEIVFEWGAVYWKCARGPSLGARGGISCGRGDIGSQINGMACWGFEKSALTIACVRLLPVSYVEGEEAVGPSPGRLAPN